MLHIPLPKSINNDYPSKVKGRDYLLHYSQNSIVLLITQSFMQRTESPFRISESEPNTSEAIPK